MLVPICGEGENGTGLIPAGSVGRGRIRVPAPVGVAWLAWRGCLVSFAWMGLESGGEGGPCNLSKSCFLGGGWFWCRDGGDPAGSTRA